MLSRIAKAILLIQFGVSVILYNSSCKRLESSGPHLYSFNHIKPFKSTELKQIVDSSHMIKEMASTTPKVPVKHYHKVSEAITPDKIDIEEMDSAAKPNDDSEPRHSIKITKHTTNDN